MAEPRANQLRWRTRYEWEALQAEGAKLGERDALEQAAFYKYRFVFTGFAVHAWYWVRDAAVHAACRIVACRSCCVDALTALGYPAVMAVGVPQEAIDMFQARARAGHSKPYHKP